ncbi:hypothetical protein [Mesorhizobium sp. M0771]|uniref:hypothetical protein n=1 Tax=Mesorhizobium sp. M0771 TaxID=2956997 RepID=UPI00333DCF08
MSSRNVRLSAEQRLAAPKLPKILPTSAERCRRGRRRSLCLPRPGKRPCRLRPIRVSQATSRP